MQLLLVVVARNGGRGGGDSLLTVELFMLFISAATPYSTGLWIGRGKCILFGGPTLILGGALKSNKN